MFKPFLPQIIQLRGPTLAGWSAVVGTLALLSGCFNNSGTLGQDENSDGRSGSKAISREAQDSGIEQLAVSLASKTLRIGNTLQLKPSGGQPPYECRIDAGPGTIGSDTCLFKATEAGSISLRIYDSVNQSIAVAFTVVGSVHVLPVTRTVAVGAKHVNTVTYFATGGTPPYHWTTPPESVGSFHSKGSDRSQMVFTPSIADPRPILLAPANYEITVTDSSRVPAGTERESDSGELIVNPELKLKSSNDSHGNEITELTTSETLQFSASDGVSPYNFSITQGPGSIDANTGLLRPSNTPGDIRVQVADSIGNIAFKDIKIKAPLNVSDQIVNISRSRFENGGTPAKFMGVINPVVKDISIFGGSFKSSADLKIKLFGDSDENEDDSKNGCIKISDVPGKSQGDSSSIVIHYTAPGVDQASADPFPSSRTILPFKANTVSSDIYCSPSRVPEQAKNDSIYKIRLRISLLENPQVILSDTVIVLGGGMSVSPRTAIISGSSPDAKTLFTVKGGTPPYTFEIHSKRENQGTVTALTANVFEYAPPKKLSLNSGKPDSELKWKSGSSLEDGAETIQFKDSEFSASHVMTEATVTLPRGPMVFGGQGINELRSMARAPGSDSSIYIVGSTTGNFDGQTGKGIRSAFVTRLSASGKRDWTRFISSGGQDEALAVAADGAGNVYVGGQTTGRLINGELKLGNIPTGRPRPDFYGFIAKFDSSGKRLWFWVHQSMPRNPAAQSPNVDAGNMDIDEAITDLTIAEETSLAATGYTTNYREDPVNPQSFIRDRDTLIAVFGPEGGNPGWFWTSSVPGPDEGTAIQYKPQSAPGGRAYIVSGTTNVPFTGDAVIGGKKDVFMLKGVFGGQTSVFQIDQYLQAGGTEDEQAYKMCMDRFYNVFLGGETASTEFLNSKLQEGTNTGSFIIPLKNSTFRPEAVVTLSGFEFNSAPKIQNASISSVGFRKKGEALDSKPSLYFTENLKDLETNPVSYFAVHSRSLEYSKIDIMNIGLKSATAWFSKSKEPKINFSKGDSKLNAMVILPNGHALVGGTFEGALSDETLGPGSRSMFLLEFDEAPSPQ